MTSFFEDDYFIFGDLNAKHTSWNNSCCNRAGNCLFQIQSDSNFFVYHPNSPTYYSNENSSTLDILLSNSILPISEMVSLCELDSDHYPILTTIYFNSIRCYENKIFNFKAANWNNFKSFIDSKIILLNEFDIDLASPELINGAIDSIIKIIIDAKIHSIPQTTRKINELPISNLCKLLITHRNHLKRRYQRCDNNSRTMFKFLINRYNFLISNYISIDRNCAWNNTLSILKTGCKKFWFINKCIRGKINRDIPDLTVDDLTLTTNIDKANALSNSFAKSFELTINNHSSLDSKVKRFIRNFDSHPEINSDTSTFTSPSEISSIISSFKSSKSPGFDQIQNILLKKLPFSLIILLTLIFNACIKTGFFPDAFKCAKVIPIPKPGKNSKLCSNYRPISLLSCLGKIFEKIISNRINNFISCNDILPQEQFGFRSHHSTIHQVCRIKNLIESNKITKKSTGMVLLDVEKAFDSVWHNGLLYKMHLLNFPNFILKLIKSFCSNRSFRVSIGNSLSSPKLIPAGVPQGSVLSPFLYSIYTSDIKKPRNANIALFADDTALITHGKLTSAIIKKLNSALMLSTNTTKGGKSI